MDTICALASAPGRAGVAVIRVSGPGAFAAAGGLVRDLPEPGRHALRLVRRADGSVIDQALVLSFKSPMSFTGEDVVELQLHGSPAAVRAILSELTAIPGVRTAEAGEFTRRAMENDRLSLTQVEGLADLIEAETEAQLIQAQRIFAGRLGEVVETLRADLLRAAALTEAMIDFADEDLPQDVTPEVRVLLAKVGAALEREIAGSHVAERIRDGFEVAIVGAPNAGKSTLLNAMAGRDAAIVSEIAGTTRDVIEVRMDLHGLPVTLLDTAGLRAAEDAVEKIGVDRAMQRAEAADLRVFLLSAAGEVPLLAPKPGDVVLVGKSDLQPGDISGKTGEGLDRLLGLVYAALSDRAAGVATATRARHREAMLAAQTALAEAAAALDRGPETIDLAAEHIRDAARRLEVLVGRLDVEAVLGEIFSSFCIGK